MSDGSERIEGADLQRRAAQYVRVSDAQQRYSLETQRELIAAFAAREGFQIVATYCDEAKSGVTLRGRDGLKALIRDVLTGPDFEAILVTDVSRWGRFQDPDEAAHYEFLCRRAGVPILYCAEVFDNSGGQASSILKNVKRVMAAEFSRQLSDLTRMAIRRVSAQGQCPGGPSPYGFAKEVVDRNTGRVRPLAAGQRKQRRSDQLRFAWGPADEVATVRRIFRDYARDGLNVIEIVRNLTAEGSRYREGLPWTGNRVRAVLDCELAIGIFTFGKTRTRFGQRDAIPDRTTWSRVRVLAPMIPPALFAKARARREVFVRRTYTDAQLLDSLRGLINRHGTVTHHLVATRAIAPPDVYQQRFKSLASALRLAGQSSTVRNGVRWRAEDLTWEKVEPVLRRLLAEQGHLSRAVINNCPFAPRTKTLTNHFGPLNTIYERLGVPLPMSDRLSLSWKTRGRRFPGADDVTALPSHLRRPKVAPLPKETTAGLSLSEAVSWPGSRGNRDGS